MSALLVLEHDMARKTPPKPEPKQVLVLTLKADPSAAEAYKSWLLELASHVGAPATVLVDMALREYARAQGFTKPAPKRTAR